ncbi:MAG: MFS transporter [Candidatus Lokiarchaeota archaeon]|nr:MFS transporter [Candidatus Lokiarchaeota archaeon]
MTEDNSIPFSFLEETSRHPWWRYASNSTFQFVVTLLSSVQGIYIVYFYSTRLGLQWNYIFACLTIFAVYDAINDPLMGWLIDRNFKWTKKWGRRFPWIVISIVPWCFSIYLLFTAPKVTVTPWPTFFWLLGSLFLYDTFGSLIGVNLGALRQDLFRTNKERRKFTYWFTYIDIAAQAAGFLLPSILLAATGDNFVWMGALVAGLGLIGAVLFLPGAREDREVIDRYYNDQGEDRPRPEFFKHLLSVLKQRSFIIAFIIMTAFNIGIGMLMSMGPFVSTFVLGFEPGGEMWIYIVFFSGTIISVPLWMWYVKKTNNLKRALVFGGLFLSISYAFLSVSANLIYIYVIFFVCGMSMGSTWAFLWTIMMLDVTDDFVVRTRSGYKAIMVGIFALLTRLVATIDEGIITLVQNYTGFPVDVATLAELQNYILLNGGSLSAMLLGIRFMIGVIPGAILLIGTIIFWIFYPLTPEKVAENKQIMRELNV